MAFLHSLARAEPKWKKGWCAPVELGNATPHYVSFVLPLDEDGGFFREYTCETVTVKKDGSKKIGPHKLVRHGERSFVLHLGARDLWFTVRAVPSKDRRLSYVGSLGHDDFASLFVEVEPEKPKELDRLYDERRTFVIGCEPFSHYAGIERLADLSARPALAEK
jgi:hypothetical protein